MNGILAEVSESRKYASLAGADNSFVIPLDDRLTFNVRDSQPVSNDEDSSITFVVSTDDQDRDGDTVIPVGFRLDNFRKNPQWYFNHQQVPLPIGSAENPKTHELSVKILPDKVSATCWFDMESPFAREIYRLVKKGLLRATSIGFLPLKAHRAPLDKAHRENPSSSGWIIEELDLLEISIVGVPANPNALRAELGGKGYSPQTLKCFGCLQQSATKSYSVGELLNGESMSKKWGKSKPKTTVQPKAEATATIKDAPAGNPTEENPKHTQAVIVIRSEQFADKDKAAADVQGRGYAVDNVEEIDGGWAFVQFPADQLQDGSASLVDLADGVRSIVGTRMDQSNTEPPKTEPEPAMKHVCTACGAKTTAKTKDAGVESPLLPAADPAQPAVDTAMPEEMDKEETIPLGAECLRDLIAHMSEKSELIEQAKVQAFYQKTLEQAKSLASSVYAHLDLGAGEAGEPDEDAALDADNDATEADVPAMKAEDEEATTDETADDTGDDFLADEDATDKTDEDEEEDDDDKETKVKPSYLSAKRTRVKRLTKRCMGTIKDAGDYLHKMSDHDEMPKWMKAGHKGHADALYKVMGLDETTDLVPGKDDELKPEEIEKINSAYENMSKRFYQLTGKDMADIG